MQTKLTVEDLLYIQNAPHRVYQYLKELELEAGTPGATTVSWGSVSGKPSTFTPSTHTHAIADITNLQSTLNGKLTASKAASQANSTATDVAGLVADFNSLLAKLKSAGVMS